MNDKEKELQMYLSDNGYVQAKELEKLWGISRTSVNETLRKHNIKPVKKLHFGCKGMVVCYSRAKCERARPFDGGEWERVGLQNLMSDKRYVQCKELAELWGLTYASAYAFLSKSSIKPIKKTSLASGGRAFLYDRAECERARPFINQPEQKEVEIAMQQDNNNQPDIIPADTIDSYTLKQLESELQNRGVEFTPVTAEIIKGSDMPEFKQIVKMLDGEADSIILSGAKLGEIAEILKNLANTSNIIAVKLLNATDSMNFLNENLCQNTYYPKTFTHLQSFLSLALRGAPKYKGLIPCRKSGFKSPSAWSEEQLIAYCKINKHNHCQCEFEKKSKPNKDAAKIEDARTTLAKVESMIKQAQIAQESISNLKVMLCGLKFDLQLILHCAKI